MSNEIVNCNQDKVSQRIDDICKNICVPNEEAKGILEVFARYVNSGVVSNTLYPNTDDGKRKFIANCYTLRQRYPSLKLIPEDVFTGTCNVKGNLMVYGKLAVKIGTQHENFNRIETRQNKHFDDNGNVKFTETKVVIYGQKNKEIYIAFEGSYISRATDTATKEAEYSKFLRQSLVKAFPDKYAFGYYEPEDGQITQSENKKQPISREEFEAKCKAKQEAKHKQEQEQEQNKVKEAEVIKPTISSKCAGYLNLIKGHIDKGNEEGLKNARSFFANKVDGLTDEELDICRRAVEEGYEQITTKKIEEGLVKDIEIQATGKVD